MTALLAIDPGAAHPGPACAYFTDGVLHTAHFSYFPGGAGLDVIVVERPEYQGDRTLQARPQDLMALAWHGGIAAGYAAGQAGAGVAIVDWTPSRWKGSEPKPVQHVRLWASLSVAERIVLGGDATWAAIDRAIERGASRRWAISGAACYGRANTVHNLLDAAALGCIYMGRLEKR